MRADRADRTPAGGQGRVPVARRSGTDIDLANLLAGLAASRRRTEAELRALRARLGLNQARFAQRSGLSIDAVQQYEQGRRVPAAPAATLLRVIAADPEAVARALHPRGRTRADKAGEAG